MTKFEFYDPHPGIGGAVVPLPKPINELIHALDGQVLTLEETIDLLTPVVERVGGRVHVSEEYQFISLRIGQPPREHGWRLLRYRLPGKLHNT